MSTNTSLSGIVYKKLVGTYNVHTDDGQVIPCSISSRLRKVLIMPTADRSSVPHQKVQAVEEISAVDPVAIGDRVTYVDAGDGTGMITEVLPRHNRLNRRAPGKQPLEQIVVANVDQVIPVIAAAQPKPKWGMLDRYLAAAESCDIPALICVTKMDALKPKEADEVQEVIDDYRRIGYPVITTSSAENIGIDTFRNALTGKTSVFIGMSGVGKTTLLNAVQPGLGLRVGEINRTIDKGRHTTTGLQMFPLEAGGAVVDTPGMKVFGFWDVEDEDVGLFFREMNPYVGLCKFGLDCHHDTEPGCAVKKAVAANAISERRYRSYLYVRDHLFSEY